MQNLSGDCGKREDDSDVYQSHEEGIVEILRKKVEQFKSQKTLFQTEQSHIIMKRKSLTVKHVEMLLLMTQVYITCFIKFYTYCHQPFVVECNSNGEYIVKED